MKKIYELRLCPFCGDLPRVEGVPYNQAYWVECDKCSSSGPSRTSAGRAARVWNDMTYRSGMGKVEFDWEDL